MMHASGLLDLLAGRTVAVLGIVCVLIMGAAEGAQSNCQVPADEYSEKIEALLSSVEGPDFPSPSNLVAWQHRKDDIEMSFATILALASDDVARRKASVQALVVMHSLSASPDEARMLGSGLEPGEVRAWTRHVLRGYASLGATTNDYRTFVDRSFIGALQEAWADTELGHPERNVALYQEITATLRGLARLQPSANCE